MATFLLSSSADTQFVFRFPLLPFTETVTSSPKVQESAPSAHATDSRDKTIKSEVQEIPDEVKVVDGTVAPVVATRR